jgi:hypothetical protein
LSAISSHGGDRLLLGLFNFCRPHMVLRVTPAMEAGIATHIWGVKEFVVTCLAEPEGERPAPCPLKPRAVTNGGAQQVTSTGFRAPRCAAPSARG